MESFNIARSDLIDQYLTRSQELLSHALVWARQLIGRSQEVSWDATSQFMTDYVLLPLVVVVVLLIVVKHALSD